MSDYSIFAGLPEGELSHQAIIRVIGDNPECSEGLLIQVLDIGDPSRTLGRIKELRANLIARQYLTIDQYRQNHTLTEKGKLAYSLLDKNEQVKIPRSHI